MQGLWWLPGSVLLMKVIAMTEIVQIAAEVLPPAKRREKEKYHLEGSTGEHCCPVVQEKRTLCSHHSVLREWK